VSVSPWAKALRKLRQPSRNTILREYLPNEHQFDQEDDDLDVGGMSIELA
jgi:hypothetical protein